jgi:predicted  nucleic acid-binding Zn-ribbon protein
MSLFCPNCLSEYVEGYKTCPKCELTLVTFADLPPHCASCGKKYAKGTLMCPMCGTELVSYKSVEDFLEGNPRPVDVAFVTVYETSLMPELMLIKGALEAAGIPYNAQGEELQSLFGAGLLGGFNPVTGTVKFIVEKRRAREAREIIEDLFKNNDGESQAK